MQPKDPDKRAVTVNPVPLGVCLSPAARQQVVDFLQSFESFEPTLGLLYGGRKSDGSVAGTWSVTAFGPETVADMIKMYAGFGAVVCYEIEGIKVVVPQLAHLAELEAGLLEFVDGRLSVVESKAS